MALNEINIPLITAEEMRRWIPNFTETINEADQLNPVIIITQQIDIAESIGEALFLDLVENRTADKYKTLLNGEKYTVSGKTKIFSGLIPAIVFYTHARYILNKNSNDTPFGVQGHTNDYGQLVSDKTLNRISLASGQTGNYYIQKVHDYLKNKKDIYTLYEDNTDCDGNSKTPSGGFVITKI